MLWAEGRFRVSGFQVSESRVSEKTKPLSPEPLNPGPWCLPLSIPRPPKFLARIGIKKKINQDQIKRNWIRTKKIKLATSKKLRKKARKTSADPPHA